MHKLTLLLFVAMPFVIYAGSIGEDDDDHEISPSNRQEQVFNTGSDRRPAHQPRPPMTNTGGNREQGRELSEDVKQDLMKGLEDTSEDRASVWTPFGVQERPAFHCTFLNNMPGTTVCCTFTSYHLLQCYTPPNYHVPWASPYGGGVGGPHPGMMG